MLYIEITSKFRLIPELYILNTEAKETKEWEIFVKSDKYCDLLLKYTKFTEKIDGSSKSKIIYDIINRIKMDNKLEDIPYDFIGFSEILNTFFKDEYTWRDDVEIELKERALKRFKKDYTSLHICENNGSIVSLKYYMKNVYTRIKWNWLAIGDPSEVSNKSNYIIGPKKDKLTIGNLRSVSNQIKLRTSKLNLIYCGVMSEPTESIIYILYSLILSQDKGSTICIIPKKMSSSLLSVIHLFSMCFEKTYIQHTYSDCYLIGRNYIKSMLNKKITDKLYTYIECIINDSDTIFPIYGSFDFISMNEFIDLLRVKLTEFGEWSSKSTFDSSEYFKEINYDKIPKNLSMILKSL